MFNVFPDRRNCEACSLAIARIRYAEKRQAKPCATCWRDLPKWRSKYCSQQCRNSTPQKTVHVNKIPTLRDCENCGNKFATHHSRFCSAKCRYQHKDRNRRPRHRKSGESREYYFSADLLTQRRKRRALIIAARQVYHELIGEKPTREKPFVTLAAAAPLVEIGDWSSYIVLPSRIKRNISKQKAGLRRTPVLVTQDGFMTYVVHRAVPWTPYINKRREWGGGIAGSYTGNKTAFYQHTTKRKKRGPKKHYPNNREQRRIKQRTDNDIFTAFKELNLLPTEE